MLLCEVQLQRRLLAAERWVCCKALSHAEGNTTELVGGKVAVKTTISNKMSQT